MMDEDEEGSDIDSDKWMQFIYLTSIKLLNYKFSLKVYFWLYIILKSNIINKNQQIKYQFKIWSWQLSL